MAIEKVKAGYSYSLGRGLPRRFIARVLALALLALLAGTALAQTPSITTLSIHHITDSSLTLTWSGSNLPDLTAPANEHLVYVVELNPNDGGRCGGFRDVTNTCFYNLMPGGIYIITIKLLNLDVDSTPSSSNFTPTTVTSLAWAVQTHTDSHENAVPLDNVTVGSISTSGATISWDSPSGKNVNFGLGVVEAGGYGGNFYYPSSPFTLTGLQPDTKYEATLYMSWADSAKQARVRPVDKLIIKTVTKTFDTLPVGQGAPPSEQGTILYSSPVVEEEPPPPLKNLRLDRIDHNSVRVRWGGQDFRGEKGSYIYRIKVRPIDGVSKSADRQTRRKRVTVNKLSANTLYTAEVQLVREADDKVLRSLSDHFSTARK